MSERTVRAAGLPRVVCLVAVHRDFPGEDPKARWLLSHRYDRAVAYPYRNWDCFYLRVMLAKFEQFLPSTKAGSVREDFALSFEYEAPPGSRRFKKSEDEKALAILEEWRLAGAWGSWPPRPEHDQPRLVT